MAAGCACETLEAARPRRPPAAIEVFTKVFA